MLLLLTATHRTGIFCLLTAVSVTYCLIYLNLLHSSFVSDWLPRGLPGTDPKRPSDWPARRHKYYFSLVIRLYLIYSIANQRFGPLPSVSYVLRMSSTSSEHVLCALMYEVNSISKNPPSTTATAVSIREDRLYRAYRLHRVYRVTEHNTRSVPSVLAVPNEPTVSSVPVVPNQPLPLTRNTE